MPLDPNNPRVWVMSPELQAWTQRTTFRAVSVHRARYAPADTPTPEDGAPEEGEPDGG